MPFLLNTQDFEYLEENLNRKNLFGSDSALANLFLLQPKYNIRLFIKNDILFRYYNGSENRNGWGFPIPLKNAKEDYLRTALQIIFEDDKSGNRETKFCLFTQAQKNLADDCLKNYFSAKIQKVAWKTNRDDCDYIYLQKNLAELSGSSYQKKRNHVARFNRIHQGDWEFKMFPDHDIAHDIMKVEEIWFDEKNGSEQEALILEKESIRSALENHELLRIYGGCLYIDGKPAAMSIASAISNDVLDVHFEKAIAQYEPDGVFAMVNNLFAKKSPEFVYLNREEDMGVEGLRKAKLSYKPEILLDKFYGKVIR